MAPKREGPFEIEEVLGPVTYQLKLPESWQIHKVFHAALLWPYWENEVYGENYIWPLPDIEEGEEVYEVKQILKHRKRGWGYKYLIKWVSYPITEALWEPKSNLTVTIRLRIYRGVTKGMFHFIFHFACYLFHSNVSHIVSHPYPSHMSVSFNDVYVATLLCTYAGPWNLFYLSPVSSIFIPELSVFKP
jgi:hypothetical protein